MVADTARRVVAFVVRGDSWWLRVGIFGAATSVLIQAPHTAPYKSATWQTVLRQGHDFLATLGPAGSHEAKRTFRLVPPLLVRFLHLSPSAYYLLQVALGVVTLALIARFLAKHGFSRRHALAVVVAIATTAIGASWFADTRPLFDALALSALVAALVSSNAAVVFLSATAALWTDERALIAAVPVLVFHWVRRHDRAAVAVVAAIAVYGAVRWWLTVRYNIAIDRRWVGISVLFDNLRYAPLALALALEGIWVLLAIGLCAMARARAPSALPVVAAVLLSAFAAVLVYDVSRSAAYLLPAVLVALVEGLHNGRLRKELFAGCAAVCVALPTAIVTGYPAMPTLLPLPLQAALWVVGDAPSVRP